MPRDINLKHSIALSTLWLLRPLVTLANFFLPFIQFISYVTNFQKLTRISFGHCVPERPVLPIVPLGGTITFRSKCKLFLFHSSISTYTQTTSSTILCLKRLIYSTNSRSHTFQTLLVHPRFG